MDVAALVISILALLTSAGGVWFARSQARSIHLQAEAACQQLTEVQRQTMLTGRHAAAAEKQAALAERQADLLEVQTTGTQRQVEIALEEVEAAKAMVDIERARLTRKQRMMQGGWTTGFT